LASSSQPPLPPLYLPAHHLGADAAPDLLDQARVDVVLAALHAVVGAEVPRGEGPLVEHFAAAAERLLVGRVRSGDVAVERQRDIQDELAHAPEDR
jgi:hypothetical protein